MAASGVRAEPERRGNGPADRLVEPDQGEEEARHPDTIPDFFSSDTSASSISAVRMSRCTVMTTAASARICIVSATFRSRSAMRRRTVLRPTAVFCTDRGTMTANVGPPDRVPRIRSVSPFPWSGRAVANVSAMARALPIRRCRGNVIGCTPATPPRCRGGDSRNRELPASSCAPPRKHLPS